MALRGNWFETMQQDMERLLDDLTRRKPPRSRFLPEPWQPPLDIYETIDSIVVLAELAGVREEDMEIEINSTRLLLRGQRQAGQQSSERKGCHQLEIYWGAFERAVNLPCPIDPNGATASFRKGMLEIVLPKVKREQTYQINVKVV